MTKQNQLALVYGEAQAPLTPQQNQVSGTFVDNMKLPVHRWFRYSAGFSAGWVSELLAKHAPQVVLDPFAGSGTVSVVADMHRIRSYGVESHPFVARLAKGKLSLGADVQAFGNAIDVLIARATQSTLELPAAIPSLLQKCYTEESLLDLYRLKHAFYTIADDLNDEVEALVFLCLSSILRVTSFVGTAQWQYVLPNKRKAKVISPNEALKSLSTVMITDMMFMKERGAQALSELLIEDARTLTSVPTDSVDLVVTSPPYANNYDYADATRLEMTFWGDVGSWGDLHGSVRKYLIRSSSQHVSKDRLKLADLLQNDILSPIRKELTEQCTELSEVRETKGGKKHYHTMVAAYFLDMAHVFHALRRVVVREGNVCLVIGDSAPYGVHVPVERWFGELALSAGFRMWSFEKLRDRNVKWKNRKHTVPLHEGRLWIKG